MSVWEIYYYLKRKETRKINKGKQGVAVSCNYYYLVLGKRNSINYVSGTQEHIYHQKNTYRIYFWTKMPAKNYVNHGLKNKHTMENILDGKLRSDELHRIISVKTRRKKSEILQFTFLKYQNVIKSERYYANSCRKERQKEFQTHWNPKAWNILTLIQLINQLREN